MSIDWKTSIPGWAAAVVVLLRLFGVQIPQEVADSVLGAVVALIGWFATSRGRL
jgi:hypothetical protein